MTAIYGTHLERKAAPMTTNLPATQDPEWAEHLRRMHEAVDAYNATKTTVSAVFLEAHDHGGWKSTHERWADFAFAEFGSEQSNSYRILNQGKVTAALARAGVSFPRAGMKEISARAAETLASDPDGAAESIRDRIQAGADLAAAVKAEVKARKPLPTPKRPTDEGAGNPDDDVLDLASEEIPPAVEPARMVTPNPRPVFTGPWRLIDLGNVVRWMRPVGRPTNEMHAAALYATYMAQWMLIGPVAHDRFPKCGGRPTLVTLDVQSGIGPLQSQCSVCHQFVVMDGNNLAAHPAVT